MASLSEVASSIVVATPRPLAPLSFLVLSLSLSSLLPLPSFCFSIVVYGVFVGRT